MFSFLRSRCSLQAAVAVSSATLVVTSKASFVAASSAEKKSNENLRVHMVTVLHRHGARTPVHQLPGHPEPGSSEYNALWRRCARVPLRKEKTFLPLSTGAEDTEPCKEGGLTQVGADMLYSLGQYLHSRYGCEFFFREGGLTVRGTVSPRTWVSAASLLQGLCPGLDRNEAFALIKLPHEGRPLQETMWGSAPVWNLDRKMCPRLTDIFKSAALRHQSSAEATSLVFERTGKQRTGDQKKDSKFVGTVIDHLDCLAAQGAAMPYGLSETEFNLARQGLLKGVVGAAESHSEEGANLSGGRLVADVHGLLERAMTETVDSCNAGLQNVSRPTFFNILSAHDVSVISFLSALGHVPEEIPGFGASCIVELLHDVVHREWHVRIMYHDQAPSSPSFHGVEVLHVPLKGWTSLVQNSLVVANDWDKQCMAQL